MKQYTDCWQAYVLVYFFGSPFRLLSHSAGGSVTEYGALNLHISSFYNNGVRQKSYEPYVFMANKYYLIYLVVLFVLSWLILQ